MQSQDARALEAITPNFLGWIGYYFWQGYALKLDYARLRATFYKGPPPEFLAGETIVAAIPFSSRKRPNGTLMPIRVGGIDALADVDIGQYGRCSPIR